MKPEQWCIEKAKDVVDAKTQGTICFTLQNLSDANDLIILVIFLLSQLNPRELVRQNQQNQTSNLHKALMPQSDQESVMLKGQIQLVDGSLYPLQGSMIKVRNRPWGK